ncbi:hypothetical protein A6J77_004040 [Aerococcus viridans]|uniref:Uncharacterized protein n=1 Tax=Aerococcus viridans TaxID=1377 RepID=A0A2J9PM76_9LACT|nr:hypothetical protein A6J77_004040 [Aerococcus viridans]
MPYLTKKKQKIKIGNTIKKLRKSHEMAINKPFHGIFLMSFKLFWYINLNYFLTNTRLIFKISLDLYRLF